MRRGTPAGTRALGIYRQAVLMLRCLDNARVTASARDNGIAVPTVYDYLYEGVTRLGLQFGSRTYEPPRQAQAATTLP